VQGCPFRGKGFIHHTQGTRPPELIVMAFIVRITFRQLESRRWAWTGFVVRRFFSFLVLRQDHRRRFPPPFILIFCPLADSKSIIATKADGPRGGRSGRARFTRFGPKIRHQRSPGPCRVAMADNAQIQSGAKRRFYERWHPKDLFRAGPLMFGVAHG